MTAKQMANIADSMEKLGYEVIKIKEKKESPDFPRSLAITKIIITPIESNAEKKSTSPFLNSFETTVKNS